MRARTITYAALKKARIMVQAKLRKLHQKLHKDDGEDVDSIIAGISLEELKELLALEPELAAVVKDGGQLFLTQLNVPDATHSEMFGQVNQRAVEYARERAAELVTGIDETTRDALRDIIAGGLADNLTLDNIADTLREAYPFSEERADLIAQTEVVMANGEGSLEGMLAAQDHGVVLKKVWLADALACDACLDNAADGPIDLDATFSGTDDDAPPGHPNCRCDMASEVEEDEAGSSITEEDTDAES